MPHFHAYPFEQLRLSPLNPRQIEPTDKEIRELAASIGEIGLQQNLIGHLVGDTFHVVGGGRRFRAMAYLAAQGALSPTFSVPVIVHDTPEEAIDAAIAENEARKAMSVVDQFLAYRDRRAQGARIPHIAAAFATDEAQVMRILALERVSPEVLDALGAGTLTLDQARAFLVEPDHARQTAFLAQWSKLNSWGKEPEKIRDYFRSQNKEGRIRTKLEQMGLARYKAAGGRFVQDLFSDHVGVQDLDVLEQCWKGWLADKQAEFAEAGWSWSTYVEAEGGQDLENPDIATRIYPKRYDYTDEEADEMAALEDLDEPTDEQLARLDALNDLTDEGVWSDDQKSVAGVEMKLDRWDGFRITYGAVRKADVDMAVELGVMHPLSNGFGRGGASKADKALVEKKAKTPQDVLPETLVAELRSLRTVATANALAQQPDLALDVLAWLMSEQPSYVAQTTIRGGLGHIHGAAGLGLIRPWEAVEAKSRENRSLADFRALGVAHRNDVLARWVAQSLQADHHNREGEAFAQLEAAASVDIREVWTPGEVFFTRLTSKQIKALFQQLTGRGPATVDERKGSLVTAIVALFADPAGECARLHVADEAASVEAVCRWLPATLRLEGRPAIAPRIAAE